MQAPRRSTASPAERLVDEILRESSPSLTRAPADVDLAGAIAWLGGLRPARARHLLRSYRVLADEDEAGSDAVTPHVLERLYEELAWRNGYSPFASRKAQGSFHTPPQLVEAMMRDALAAFLLEHGATLAEAASLVAPSESATVATLPRLRDAVEALRIVDPSVGPGSFLVGALRVLRDLRARLGLSATPAPATLCGVDVSPLAVDVCRVRLALAGYATAHLEVGDSLTDGRRFSWRRNFRDVFEHGGFDVVIGNPPYLRDRSKKNLDAAALGRAYRAATSHYDLYVLFMERALQIVRKGGVVSLLTSNRWLGQKYGRGIREVLLEQRLWGVVDLRFRAFDAAVRTSITLVSRAEASTAPVAGVALVAAEALERVPSLVLDANLPRVDVRTLDGGSWRFGLTSAEAAIGARMRAAGTPLAEVALVTLGMVFHDPRPGGRRKADYLRAEKHGRFKTPLLDGEHVARWRAEGGLWLDYRPSEHREPRFARLFEAPKVLCRRILGPHAVMAMVDREGRFFSDNVVGVVRCCDVADADARIVRTHCTPDRVSRSQAVDLDYLTAVLNSRIINWYYQKLQGFGMHFYPAHVKGLPLILAPRAHQQALAKLARQAVDASAAARRDIERDIDDRVTRLYGLSAQERAIVCGEVV